MKRKGTNCRVGPTRQLGSDWRENNGRKWNPHALSFSVTIFRTKSTCRHHVTVPVRRRFRGLGWDVGEGRAVAAETAGRRLRRVAVGSRGCVCRRFLSSPPAAVPLRG